VLRLRKEDWQITGMVMMRIRKQGFRRLGSFIFCLLKKWGLGTAVEEPCITIERER
jgi:hypothetical protein